VEVDHLTVCNPDIFSGVFKGQWPRPLCVGGGVALIALAYGGRGLVTGQRTEGLIGWRSAQGQKPILSKPINPKISSTL